ncbi:MAG: 23S rRNA (adenine(2503)-C(2))-methyltransferase RlmN [Tannerella sp.]|jgi:23S rRNA (adenine2503-C2)-methyltransferase|nr:23S rRNA (adenine(2503)-C(2))-methyltransferase RlmN [Tannerella sp.]
MESKTYLSGMTMEELKGVADLAGLPAYASRQLADWLYKKKITSISEMTNISASKRDFLENHYEVGYLPPVERMVSSDKTVKYLFLVAMGRFVETVFIPADERATLCVSSQVGCKMNCRFCMTGKQGFAGDLTATEILNQIRSVSESDQLSNVVFMGMGEPFDNIEALFKVLEIMTSSYGFGWSPKRITVSTAGILKGLLRFLNESSCNLAISIHSPYPDERRSLMPIETANPIKDMIQLIRQYDFSHQRRVSFEYILFDNLNDSVRHAKDLAQLIAGIPCRVNLIHYHTIPDIPLQKCSLKNMELFRDTLNKKGITCTIRTSRGEDIAAACGMLSTAQTEKKKEKYQ